MGATKAAESCLGCFVGLGNAASNMDIGNEVVVINVAQGPGQHGFGHIQAPAAVSGEDSLQSQQFPVLGESGLPRGVEAVPLARHGHIQRAVEADSNGPPRE